MTRKQYLQQLERLVHEGCIEQKTLFDQIHANIVKQARFDKELCTQDYIGLIQDINKLLEDTWFQEKPELEWFQDQMNELELAWNKGKLDNLEYRNRLIELIDMVRTNKWISDNTAWSFAKKETDKDNLNSPSISIFEF